MKSFHQELCKVHKSKKKLNKQKIFVIKNKIKPQIYFEKIQTKNYHRNSKKNRKTEKN